MADRPGKGLLPPEGFTPPEAGCRMIAWIRDSSNQGALDQAWVSVCRFQRSRLLEYSQNVSRYRDSTRAARSRARGH